MPPKRRKFENDLPPSVLPDYRMLVNGEKMRSERYNRFFVVFGLIAAGIADGDLVGVVKSELRASDSVFVIPETAEPKPAPQCKLGVLLPETDVAGADQVKSRLGQLFRAKKISLQMGQAVYPDDATVPDQLLGVAFSTALPLDLFQNRGGVETTF